MHYQRATRRNGDGEEREVIVRRVKRDEEGVCYGDVGCFRDEGPFDYLDMLPSPPEEVGTKILLYTRDARRHFGDQSGLPKIAYIHCRENRDLSQVLDYNNASAVAESNFNASLPVKIIIHGFGSTCLRLWAREMRVSFLAVVSHCSIKFPGHTWASGTWFGRKGMSVRPLCSMINRVSHIITWPTIWQRRAGAAVADQRFLRATTRTDADVRCSCIAHSRPRPLAEVVRVVRPSRVGGRCSCRCNDWVEGRDGPHRQL